MWTWISVGCIFFGYVLIASGIGQSISVVLILFGFAVLAAKFLKWLTVGSSDSWIKISEGATDEQKMVINYFTLKTYLGTHDEDLDKLTRKSIGRVKPEKAVSDAEFDKFVNNKLATEVELAKQRGIAALGLDESELLEIEPFHFESFYFGESDEAIDEWVDLYTKHNPYFFTPGTSTQTALQKTLKGNQPKSNEVAIMFGQGLDGKFRTSAIQITWIFTTAKQVCVYREDICLHKTDVDELAMQFPWNKVSSFASMHSTVKYKIKGDSIKEKIDSLRITVSGNEYTCSMTSNDYTRRAIAAMKQRLVDFG
jgi:hypothetical protein